MIPLKPGALPELDPWGTIADLGAEILEGECAIQGKMIWGTPDAPASSAYFGVGKGRFRMVYPFNEHAIVVEGSVTLTNERTGTATTYAAGEGWFVEKGTPVLWEVHTDRFVKNYAAIA